MPNNKQHFKHHGKRLTSRRTLPTITNEVGAMTLLELPEAEFRAAVKQLLDSRFFSLADVAVLEYAREEKDDEEN